MCFDFDINTLSAICHGLFLSSGKEDTAYMLAITAESWLQTQSYDIQFESPPHSQLTVGFPHV